MPISVERFAKALTKIGIVTQPEAEALVNGLPAEKRAGDADELARELVRQGKLTRFQAAAIYQDKTDGLLLGNYLILDKLGAGGMGQVFRARHRRMDRVVAIKVLSKKLLDSPDAVARFQREVKAAARLAHPHIVTAYDADEANGLHFLVMEYVDGSDLAAIVKQQGALPVNQALDYLLQAARGLEHAHGEEVVHRDIKPSNLLLDKKGTLKILDMGLARMSDPLADPNAAPGADLTQSGSIMGTIDYMAPEQAMDSRQADARSDIYSLGCTLHYLLTARPPFGGDSVLKRLTAHQQAAIPLLSTIRADIPPGFDEVFGRMMAKRPAARFQTSKELVAALDGLRNQPASSRPMPMVAQAIAVQPVAAVPATPVPSGMRQAESIILPGIERGSRKPPKSSSKLPLVAAAVVLLLAAAGAGMWMMSGQKPEQVAQSQTIPTDEAPQQPVAPPPAATTESKTVEPPAPPMPADVPPTTPPATLPAPVADPPAASPTVMPAQAEPPAEPAANVAPPVGAPTVTDMAQTKPAPPGPAAVSPAVAVESTPPPAEQPAADAKLPIPAADGRRESLTLIQEIYKDDYAQLKTPEAKAALAEKMLNESQQQTKDDATALYSLLNEARDLAVAAANPALAERAIGMMAGRFAIEPLQELAKALDEMAGKSHPADANRAISEAALARVEEAQATDDFETAKQFSDAALMAARKSKDSALMKRAVEVGKTVVAAKQQWEAWQKAQAVLAKTPEDPPANLAVGRYQCLVQGDWDQGLAHLAKGPEGQLKDLAAKSLKPPEDAAALADLADAWFNAAEKAKGKEKTDLRAGAAYWYSQAEPGLTGLVKTVVEKRLKDLGGAVAMRAAGGKTPVANGLWLPQTFDCAVQVYSITLGAGFNIQKSWTLAFEFRPPRVDPKGRQVFLFYWGDERFSHDPIVIKITGDRLEGRFCDTFKDRDDSYSLIHKLSPDMGGRWQQFVVHFGAAANEFALLLNGVVVAQGRSTIVPTVDRPMPISLGGFREGPQRFTGQIRNVWLGNTDKTSPFDVASSTPAAVNSGGKLPETTDLAIGPGVGMKFRLIPAGTFTMGTPRGNPKEFPHQVNITQPFYLGVTEVTQAQWLAVMGNNPSTSPGDPQRPVEQVSWNDCQQFLQRLNQSLAARKLRFRLPTEAEWEYACRAGTTTKYSFGDDPALLTDYGWFTGNASGTLRPVAQRKPNPWGLFDMHGGVWEWCSDWFDAEYFHQSPMDDPQGPATGATRAVRGGSYWNDANASRSAERGGNSPDKIQPNYGLRIACESKAARPLTAPKNPTSNGPANPVTGSSKRPMAFNQADVERNVAHWVLSVGGKVKVTSPAAPAQNPHEITDAAQLPAEPFLVFGIELFDCKTIVDKDLARIEDLANLNEFRIRQVAIGEEGLAHVAHQRNLVTLYSRGTKVDDGALAAIEGMSRLQTLTIMEGAKVTDAGLVHLRGLTDLQAVWLNSTAVTGAGLKHLRYLPQLRTLGLVTTKLSVTNLNQLAEFRTLSILNIDGTPAATDSGLPALRAMPALTELDVGHSSVSDQGLQVLATFPGLKKLRVSGSRVTDAGVQRFRQLRPDCEIVR